MRKKLCILFLILSFGVTSALVACSKDDNAQSSPSSAPSSSTIASSVPAPDSDSQGASVSSWQTPASDSQSASDSSYQTPDTASQSASDSQGTSDSSGQPVVTEFSLSFSAESEQGTVSAKVGGMTAPSGVLVSEGSEVVLTATAVDGYVFVGWFEGDEQVSSSATFTFAMPASEKSFVARFSKAKYVLTYSAPSADGSVTGTVDSGSEVTAGETVVLTVTANAGRAFVGWFVGSECVWTGAEYSFTMPAEAVEVEARFTLEKRTVYCYDGTDLIDTVEVDYGATATLISPSKANYNFLGWFEDRAFTKLFDGRCVTENLSLFARWEQTAIYFEVTFVDWDDSRIGSVQSVEQGKSAIIPANPSRVGHDFAGWSSEDSYTAVTKDVTVRATYTKKTYSVVFLWDEDGEVYSETTVEYLGKVSMPRTPVREDYIFATWQYNGYDYDFDLAVDEEITLYATWTEKPAKTYTVTFYHYNGEVLDVQTVAEGAAAIAPPTRIVTGYKFIGWDKSFDHITEDTEVYATYDKANFTVTFVYYKNGEETSDPQSVRYMNAAAAPTAGERDGYDFIGWDRSFGEVTEDMTVTAIYEKRSYRAVFYNGETELAREYAEHGESFAVPDTPSVAGYSFIGWYGDALFTSDFDFTAAATGDVNVYGKFEKIVLQSYTVNFVDHNGEVFSAQTVVKGNSAIDPGKPTRTGYDFVGWDKAFDNVTSDLEVLAVYEIKTFTIEYYKEDKTTLIDKRTVSYGADASALIEAPAVEGKDFLGWSADLGFVDKDASVYAVYDAHVLKVYFVEANGEQIYVKSVKYGGTASVPDTPSKTGYIFIGWCATAELDSAFDFNTAIVNEEGTYVYASWEKASGLYSVYFKDYDGNAYGNVQRVVAGYYAIEPSAPVKAGVEFDGWYIEGTNVRFDFDTMPVTRSLTLVARGNND